MLDAPAILLIVVVDEDILHTRLQELQRLVLHAQTREDLVHRAQIVVQTRLLTPLKREFRAERYLECGAETRLNVIYGGLAQRQTLRMERQTGRHGGNGDKKS